MFVACVSLNTVCLVRLCHSRTDAIHDYLVKSLEDKFKDKLQKPEDALEERIDSLKTPAPNRPPSLVHRCSVRTNAQRAVVSS